MTERQRPALKRSLFRFYVAVHKRLTSTDVPECCPEVCIIAWCSLTVDRTCDTSLGVSEAAFSAFSSSTKNNLIVVSVFCNTATRLHSSSGNLLMYPLHIIKNWWQVLLDAGGSFFVLRHCAEEHWTGRCMHIKHTCVPRCLLVWDQKWTVCFSELHWDRSFSERSTWNMHSCAFRPGLSSL